MNRSLRSTENPRYSRLKVCAAEFLSPGVRSGGWTLSVNAVPDALQILVPRESRIRAPRSQQVHFVRT